MLRLLIGKFCAIAAGVRFVMAAANHLNSGPSTFPFTIFPGRWQDETLETFHARTISKGDTAVGNDVWFGRDVTVMPGVTIGNGAIIATPAEIAGHILPMPGRGTRAWWDEARGRDGGGQRQPRSGGRTAAVARAR
jgi:virginiamycin A acetyltransferase